MSKALEIMDQVCRKHKTTPAELKSHRRSETLAAARLEFIQLADAELWPVTVIARLLNRDHSTICYHIQKMRPLSERRSA